MDFENLHKTNIKKSNFFILTKKIKTKSRTKIKIKIKENLINYKKLLNICCLV